MEKFVYDIFDTIETPTFVLSNIYHHHIGVINNIDVDSINTNFNMASAQEMSFDVYKEVDGEVCDVWDSIVGLKYVFVPEFNEYYKADVTLNEDNRTVKSVTLTSAGEYELSNKKIVNLEINTESDILQEDYVTTVFYDENNPRGSLLDRVLNDKAPDWSIGHVDDTLKNIQRTFSINGQTIYDTLVNTIAKEINCLFTFDSVNRVINAYDLLNKCSSCGYRGEFLTTCPKCGGKEFIRGYGENSNILINYNNYSEKMTVDGGEDKVKNCFKVTGGDDNMNAAIRNCNPNGSHYIYSFSDADYEDMPPELVQKLIEYGEMYEEILPEYEEVVAQFYNNLNCYHYYKTTMMPRLSGKHWEANKGYDVGDRAYVMTLPTWCYLECVQAGVSGNTEFDATRVTVDEEFIDGTVIWQAKKNIIDVPSAQQSLDAIIEYFVSNEIYFLNNIPSAITEVNNEVKNIAALQINNIFRIEIILDDDNKVEGNIWTGRIKVYNTGNEEDTATSENPVTVYLKISSEPMDYINYMSNKVEKRLNKKDVEFTSIFDIEIPRDENYNYLPDEDTEFKEALTGYGLDWLSNFSKSYHGCIQTLITNGVTDEDSDIVGYELYNPMYVPYYERMGYINDELAVRQATVDEYKALYKANESTMSDYHKQMNMRTFLGDDLYKTLYNYIREDDYNNTNYISDGLSSGEILQDARTLLELANDELLKANTLQYTLSDSLENLLNTEEFKDHKDKLKIGDYLICEADEKLYRLRLIGVSYGYSSPDKINVTFSNYVAIENYFSDAQNILATAKSMSTSYGAVMHQVDKSATVTDEVTTWMEDSLSSAVTTITNNDNEEVTIDENGIIAREYDDVSDTYSDEQLRITHNIIAFTDDAWETSTLGLGKQSFMYYSNDPDDPGWKEDIGYGLNAKFVNSGYIYGTQIVAGEMYSENYEAGHYGSHINLNDGSFDLAGGGLIGRWNSDTHSYDLNYTGDVEGVLDVGVGSHLGTWTVYDDGLYSGVSVLKPDNIYVTGNVRAVDFLLGNTLLSSILDKKQAKLNAGTNITLTPEQDGTVTISATGGGGTGDVNLYYGVTTPSDSLGDNKDLYVQLTPDPSGMVNSLTYQTSRECNSRSATVENNIFTINANWYVDRYEHAFLGYRIDGLTSGEEYTISFTARFKNAVEIPGYSELVGLTVQNTSGWASWGNPATNGQFEEYHSGNNVYYFQSFPGDTTKHNYSFTFTASSSNYLFLYPDGIRNDTSVDMEITNLFISDGTVSDNIINLYAKIEDEWMPYNTGLKYWKETSDDITRKASGELSDGWTFDHKYARTSLDFIMEISPNSGTREFKKINSGLTACCRCSWGSSNPNEEKFNGFIMMSPVEDNVKTSPTGGYTTYTYMGKTFYVSGGQNVYEVHSGYVVDDDGLIDIGFFSTYEEAFNYFCQLANVQVTNTVYKETGIGIKNEEQWSCDEKWLRTSVNMQYVDNSTTRSWTFSQNTPFAICTCQSGTSSPEWIDVICLTPIDPQAECGTRIINGKVFYYFGWQSMLPLSNGARWSIRDNVIEIGYHGTYEECVDYFIELINLNVNDGFVFWGGDRYGQYGNYPFSVDNVGNIHAHTIDVIKANPSDTATKSLNKIKINGDTYNVESGASAVSDLTDVELSNLLNGQILTYNSTTQKWENSTGSGGSEVVPNPIGTPTDTLNKVEIDGTIYNIPSGGSGGGGMSSTLLYTGTSRVDTITLSESFRNFDYIYIMGYANVDTGYWRESMYRVDELNNTNRIGICDDSAYLWYSITDDTHLARQNYSGSYHITSIYGMNEGTNESKTLVYTLTAGSQWETFTNPNSSNPLVLEAENKGAINSWQFIPEELPSRDSGDNYVTIGTFPNTNLAINLGQTNNGGTICLSTNGNFDTSISSVKVYSISSSGGSGGGTEVVPNPSDEATALLKKVKIGNSTFDAINTVGITEEGYNNLPSTKENDDYLYMVKTAEDIFDGESSITLLGANGITLESSEVSDYVGTMSAYEYSAGFEGFNIALNNLTIGESYVLDFDFQFTNASFIGTDYRCAYLISGSQRTDYSNYSAWTENLARDLNLHHHRESFTATASTMYIVFNLCGCSDSVNNYFTINNIIVCNSTAQNKIIYNGDEYGSSGSTDVEANPQGTPTDTLSSIKIGNTIYDIESSGGGGSGEGYTRDTLYSSQITTPQQVTLSSNIDDYDVLEVVVAGGTSLTPYQIDVNYFKETCPYVANPTYENDHWIIHTYQNRYIRIIMGDANNKIYPYDINNQTIEEINGIKYNTSGGSVVLKEGEYANFSNAGYIALPFTLNSDYILEVDYEATVNRNNNSVIGLSNGSTGLIHLTQWNDQWAHGTGTGETFYSDAQGMTSRHIYKCNYNGHNYLDSSEMSTFTPSTDSTVYYHIGSRGTGNLYTGKIYSYKLTSISTGDVITHLKPMRLMAGKVILKEGLYDLVNDKFYSCNGMTIVGEGGGSIVIDAYIEPNSEEEPTETLENIKIDDIVYSVGGGNVDDVYVNGESVLDTNKIAQVKTHKEVSLAEYEDANDDIIYFVDDDDDELGIYYSPVIYSTEEREIGTWTDGKSLYEKTIYIGTMTRDSSWHPTAHGISNIEKVVEVCGQTKQSTDGRGYSIPHYRPSNQEGISVGADTTNVYYMNTWLEYASDTYATIRYTKTTDTPGSAKYNALGVPMIHYSTDEQVIGTWIDGKPIYRRTWNFSTGVTVSSNSWQATDIAVADTHINVITDCKALNDDGQMMNYISATTDLATQTYVMLFNSRTNAGMVVKYLTLEYTKTTD